jgi:hypothetical protein
MKAAMVRKGTNRLGGETELPNDHTPIPGSTPAMLSITLQDAMSGQTATE